MIRVINLALHYSLCVADVVALLRDANIHVRSAGGQFVVDINDAHAVRAALVRARPALIRGIPRF
jgi:hypothetical protein